MQHRRLHQNVTTLLDSFLEQTTAVYIQSTIAHAEIVYVDASAPVSFAVFANLAHPSHIGNSNRVTVNMKYTGPKHVVIALRPAEWPILTSYPCSLSDSSSQPSQDPTLVAGTKTIMLLLSLVM